MAEVRRDFRGKQLPTGILELHPAGVQRTGDVMQACPECPVNNPAPFCPVCLGAGLITNERLDRYSWANYQEAKANGMALGKHGDVTAGP